MIGLSEKLEIKASEFMYVVRNSVFEDARMAGMEEISITDVAEGFTYYKNLSTFGGKESKVKTLVNCYKEYSQYSATVTSGSGEYAITYMVEEVEDGILVTYTEADSYQKTLRKWNSNIMTWLLGGKKKKSVVAMLKAIEEYVLQNRSDITRKIKNLSEAVVADCEISGENGDVINAQE